MAKNKLNEISNPIEFQKQYLSEINPILCPFCLHTENKDRTSFLQVATLEQIKNLHKHESFESVRRKFYTIILITSGSVKETIGYNTYTFEEGTLYFIPENQLHTIHKWSDDVKGYHCIFDAEYFLLCLKNQIKLSKYPFFQIDKAPYVELREDQSEELISLLLKMNLEFTNRKTVNDDLLVRLYLNIFLIEAERIYQSQSIREFGDLSRKEQLVARFRLLISEHLTELKQVSDYANRLFVNPHYLNDTVKEVTGSTASDLINQQLLTEAKAYLIQTDKGVAEIADELNFGDQSYFARFFKKHARMTPTEFRERHEHQ